MRFLCVSDIHGHAAALEAVLEYASALGWDQLIACGDLVFPGPTPLRVWQLLVKHRAVCVQGVSDRAVAQIDPAELSAATPSEQERIGRLKGVHAELGRLIVARLGKLEKTARLDIESGGGLVVVHGSPADPTEPLGVEMSDDELSTLIGDDPADIIVCGGSHVPFDRSVGDTRILNVGSVGEAPEGGVAHATLLETAPVGIAVRQLYVPL